MSVWHWAPVRKTSGESREIVSKFPLTNIRFSIAWKALTEAYDNTRILVNDQLKKLISIPTLEHETSSGLKNIQRGIRPCLSQMSVNKLDTKRWDPILVFLYIQRLPNLTVTLWEQNVKNKAAMSSWEDMDFFLTERIQTLTCLHDLKSTETTPTYSKTCADKLFTSVYPSGPPSGYSVLKLDIVSALTVFHMDTM